MIKSDVVVIGGGVVGLATAWQLSRLQPRLSLTVLEKEQEVAAHQTGHNSGVLHSGIYYKPGSLKAENCRLGKLAMEVFCSEYGIPFDRCGKVIVAVEESEFAGLERIYERGLQNGVACSIIDKQRLAELEPHARGERAIHVPEAGIVDYAQVAERLAQLLRDAGHRIELGRKVNTIRRGKVSGRDEIIVTSQGEYACRLIVNCGGLHCDRIASIGRQPTDARIIPFRGEYYELIPEKQYLCKNLIYPVPDPNFPFLGVHFTRMIHGGVECGPNAVLAFAREGYTKSTINVRDLSGTLAFPGFWKMVRRHWKMGCGEMWRSFSKRAFVKALRRLMPEIQASDLKPAPAGVRAQAMLRNGQLVDDFLIQEDETMVSVLNAPSPAATASLNIGKLVAERVLARIDATVQVSSP